MRRLVHKKAKKKLDGKCAFCPCTEYCALDLHRITQGKDGGKYTAGNSVTCCAVCHRKIHDGQITILGKHFSTAGKWVIHYQDNEGEKWV